MHGIINIFHRTNLSGPVHVHFIFILSHEKLNEKSKTDWWVVFSGYSGSSTNKTDRHDITEILLKEVLNIINQTKTDGIRSSSFSPLSPPRKQSFIDRKSISNSKYTNICYKCTIIYGVFRHFLLYLPSTSINTAEIQ